jgi:hypothetical protein
MLVPHPGHRPNDGPHGTKEGAVRPTDHRPARQSIAEQRQGLKRAIYRACPSNRFNWGGYFNTGGLGLANPATGEGRADLMHYDLMPYRGAITDQYRKLGALPGVKYGQAPEKPTSKSAEVHGSPL